MRQPTRRTAPGRMTVLGGGLLIVLVSAPAQAQVFKSGIDMVALTVTVNDERGLSVSGLTAEHFAVYEDGAQQQISLFGGADVPLDVALVADASSSMLLRLPAVKEGAQALLPDRDTVPRAQPRARCVSVHSPRARHLSRSR